MGDYFGVLSRLNSGSTKRSGSSMGRPIAGLEKTYFLCCISFHDIFAYLAVVFVQKKHQILPDSLVFNHVSSSGTTRYLHCFRTQYPGVTLDLHSVTHWSGTIIGAVVLAPAAQEKRCG